MVVKMDESVGRVVSALEEANMLHNSIIVFLSDNGAPTIGRYPNWGSNFPLRGIKETLWEGGVRGAGFIWSPLLNQVPRVSNQLMHITDWLPTLYSAAGGSLAISLNLFSLALLCVTKREKKFYLQNRVHFRQILHLFYFLRFCIDPQFSMHVSFSCNLFWSSMVT